AHQLPRQLGVSRLVLREAPAQRAHSLIAGRARTLVREQRREGFANAPITPRGLEHGGKGGHTQGREGLGQGRGSPRLAATSRSATVAQRGVLELIERGAVHQREQLGGRTEREQLERYA